MIGKFGGAESGREAPQKKFKTVDLMEVSNDAFKTFMESKGIKNFPWEKVDLSKPGKRKLIIELFLDIKL